MSGTSVEQLGAERPATSTVLWAGVWFALMTGFIEAGVLTFRLLDHQFIHRSRDFLWMTPAGYLVLFAVPLAVITGIYRLTRFPFRTAIFVLATGSVGSVLLLLLGRKLHPAALALLAVGAGFQIARVAGSRSEGFRRVSRTAPWMLGLLILVWAGTRVERAWAERRAIARLPEARQGATNVVLIILDTVRAASLGLYGYPKNTTPELERWAARGVVFDHAIATAPWTLPSHASMFTGRMPAELSADWLTPLDDRWPTLAESLRDHGYRTGAFVGNLIYATWEHGLDRGFQHYDDYPFSLGMLIRHTQTGRRLTDLRRIREIIGSDELVSRKSAERIGADFLAWLDRDRSRPFFAFLNYYDAHDPYLPPDEYFRRMAGHERENKLSPFRRAGAFVRSGRVTSEDVAREMAGYDGAIAYLDAQLGLLFKDLEQRDLLQHTLVIVASDHGEEFGEHGVFLHGHTLYRQALHVPLLILGAGTVEGARVRPTISLRDLPATVMDLLAMPPGFPGQSLRRFWTDSAAVSPPALSMVSQGIRIPEWYPAAGGDMQSLTDDHRHYIRQSGGKEALYDWLEDPTEMRNLIDRVEFQSELPSLRRSLDSLSLPVSTPARER